jgi:Flp pilus assembly protein TadG
VKRGQALVEFALIAPLFLVLFVGLADMGRGLLAYTELAMGSRAGARQAVLQYNAGSNQSASSACTGSCVAPGVVPIIKQQAGFGFPVVYTDSSSTTTVPANAALSNDPNWTANGSAPPYDISLTSGAATNTIYVFTYEYNPASSTRAARWPVAGSARDPGHQMVVVDLKLKWTSVTLSLLGFAPTLTLDAQSVQRIEY